MAFVFWCRAPASTATATAGSGGGALAALRSYKNSRGGRPADGSIARTRTIRCGGPLASRCYSIHDSPTLGNHVAAQLAAAAAAVEHANKSFVTAASSSTAPLPRTASVFHLRGISPSFPGVHRFFSSHAAFSLPLSGPPVSLCSSSSSSSSQFVFSPSPLPTPSSSVSSPPPPPPLLPPHHLVRWSTRLSSASPFAPAGLNLEGDDEDEDEDKDKEEEDDQEEVEQEEEAQFASRSTPSSPSSSQGDEASLSVMPVRHHTPLHPDIALNSRAAARAKKLLFSAQKPILHNHNENQMQPAAPTGQPTREEQENDDEEVDDDDSDDDDDDDDDEDDDEDDEDDDDEYEEDEGDGNEEEPTGTPSPSSTRQTSGGPLATSKRIHFTSDPVSATPIITPLPSSPIVTLSEEELRRERRKAYMRQYQRQYYEKNKEAIRARRQHQHAAGTTVVTAAGTRKKKAKDTEAGGEMDTQTTAVAAVGPTTKKNAKKDKENKVTTGGGTKTKSKKEKNPTNENAATASVTNTNKPATVSHEEDEEDEDELDEDLQHTTNPAKEKKPSWYQRNKLRLQAEAIDKRYALSMGAEPEELLLNPLKTPADPNTVLDFKHHFPQREDGLFGMSDVLDVAEHTRAINVSVYEQSDEADAKHMVFMTGLSRRHMNQISDTLIKKARTLSTRMYAGPHFPNSDILWNDRDSDKWTLIHLGRDVGMVNIMSSSTRNGIFAHIEEEWFRRALRRFNPNPTLVAEEQERQRLKVAKTATVTVAGTSASDTSFVSEDGAVSLSPKKANTVTVSTGYRRAVPSLSPRGAAGVSPRRSSSQQSEADADTIELISDDMELEDHERDFEMWKRARQVKGGLEQYQRLVAAKQLLLQQEQEQEQDRQQHQQLQQQQQVQQQGSAAVPASRSLTPKKATMEQQRRQRLSALAFHSSKSSVATDAAESAEDDAEINQRKRRKRVKMNWLPVATDERLLHQSSPAWQQAKVVT